jgi:hypothetical protein
MGWHDLVFANRANGQFLDIPLHGPEQRGCDWIKKNSRREIATLRFPHGALAKILREHTFAKPWPKVADRGWVATASEKLPIVAQANTENSRFTPESAFCPLHRFGDLRDWCSSFRMRFEFLNVFFRPRTAMRCRFLRRHVQSP